MFMDIARPVIDADTFRIDSRIVRDRVGSEKSGVFPEIGKIPPLPGLSLDAFHGAYLHWIFA
jgi:hypothetical protein